MIEVGQLRRWIGSTVPLPVKWEGKLFLIVEEHPRWIDKEGRRRSSWTFIIDGQLEQRWRDEDIARMSEVVCDGTNS